MQLQRDELIMNMSDVVKTLVKKYNKKQDEDLYQTGMLACVKGVDSALEKNINNPDIIKAICIVSARNAILNYIRDSNYYDKHIYDECDAEDFIYGKTEEITGDIDLAVDIYNNVDNKTYDVYKYSIEGYTPEEISSMMNLSVPQIYVYLDKLKYFIYNHKHT